MNTETVKEWLKREAPQLIASGKQYTVKISDIEFMRGVDVFIDSNSILGAIMTDAPVIPFLEMVIQETYQKDKEFCLFVFHPGLKLNFAATRQIYDACETDPHFREQIEKACYHFNKCDWGSLGAEDRHDNDRDLMTNDGHILGKYATDKGDIYINRDLCDGYDEPALIMFCEEY